MRVTENVTEKTMQASANGYLVTSISKLDRQYVLALPVYRGDLLDT